MSPLNDSERARYERHLRLPEIGVHGQERLKAASVLLVGCGGLGSPMGIYLAAAGVGRIGLVDFDRVDLSNLQRQILFTTADVDRSKVQITAQRLKALNPEILIDVHEERFSAENGRRLVASYDLVADGADNFATRYLVNDACVLENKVLISASVLNFEGQLAAFHCKGGPCYRCLYPEPPPAGSVPSCAENGVLGVLPGTMALLQATEVLKRILQIGRSGGNHLFHFDALEMKLSEFEIVRDPDCAVCGDHPSIRELRDHASTCDLPLEEDAVMSVEELDLWRQQSRPHFLLDVREPDEIAISRISPSHSIPLGELEPRIDEVPKDTRVIVYCHSGARSARATAILRQRGVDAYNLSGGILAWTKPGHRSG